MTHTLHRRETDSIPGKDFVILSMAAQKFNDRGAGEKFKKMFRLLLESNPDNLADDNFGGIHTGRKPEEILERMNDKACLGAAFSDEERLKEALRRLKEADLGMSVIVTGDLDAVFRILKEVGLKPHTVNLSLGTFGKKEVGPREEVLDITCMCGHGMVTPRHVEVVSKKVKAGRMEPEAGAKELARSCTCGIFNPRRAAGLLQRLPGEGD